MPLITRTTRDGTSREYNVPWPAPKLPQKVTRDDGDPVALIMAAINKMHELLPK
jgi:hypothetical protein